MTVNGNCPSKVLSVYSYCQRRVFVRVTAKVEAMSISQSYFTHVVKMSSPHAGSLLHTNPAGSKSAVRTKIENQMD